jgi:hypothetical protein
MRTLYLVGDIIGGWVESCTALVEDTRGYMEILRWASPAAEPALVSHVSGEIAAPA